MSWNPQYAILIAISTLLTYASGILIEKCSSSKLRKAILYKRTIVIVCISLNLLILGIFKYSNFIIGSINHVLQYFRVGAGIQKVDLLLPVGISFYTFQALGYIIDVYRGNTEAEKNIIRYALFVSFFPQLVAGPIERSGNLLRQIKDIKSIQLRNAQRIISGVILMIWGFFVKMVIADRLAILVDTVFNDYQMYGSTELCLAAIGFAIQIYCDFSGYSFIAIGAAKIMGFSLMENFCAPYFAVSVKDFWNRWHISLSSWFKDYLYIPLGGSRKGIIRKLFNKIVVFSVSGLWHGADWSYAAWGGIHGIYQVLGDVMGLCKEKILKKMHIKTQCFSWKLLRMAVTFVLVDFAWIFFRADSIKDAFCFIKRIFIRPTPWILFNGGIYELGLGRTEMDVLGVSLGILFFTELIRYKKRMTIDAFLIEQNLWFRWGMMILLISMIFIFGKYGPEFDARQFIYFQF